MDGVIALKEFTKKERRKETMVILFNRCVKPITNQATRIFDAGSRRGGQINSRDFET
jgi:hypothetical protein